MIHGTLLIVIPSLRGQIVLHRATAWVTGEACLLEFFVKNNEALAKALIELANIKGTSAPLGVLASFTFEDFRGTREILLTENPRVTVMEMLPTESEDVGFTLSLKVDSWSRSVLSEPELAFPCA